jgi:hypothetical protein
MRGTGILVSKAKWSPATKARAEGCRPGWCVVHSDFAWFYDDGSIGCVFDYIVEGAQEECGEILPVKLEVIKGRRPLRARNGKST